MEIAQVRGSYAALTVRKLLVASTPLSRLWGRSGCQRMAITCNVEGEIGMPWRMAVAQRIGWGKRGPMRLV